MSNTRHMLSAVALSLVYSLVCITCPGRVAVEHQRSGDAEFGPVVEQVTPAVVNILVSGKKVTRQEIPEQFRFFFGLMP